MKNYIIFFCFFLFISCSSDAKEVSVIELNVKIQQANKIQILDVRNASIASEGMITKAKNYDSSLSGFDQFVSESFDKSKNIYVYCNTGVKSKKICSDLIAKGYSVVNIKGGYKKWNAYIKKVN